MIIPLAACRHSSMSFVSPNLISCAFANADSSTPSSHSRRASDRVSETFIVASAFSRSSASPKSVAIASRFTSSMSFHFPDLIALLSRRLSAGSPTSSSRAKKITSFSCLYLLVRIASRRSVFVSDAFSMNLTISSCFLSSAISSGVLPDVVQSNGLIFRTIRSFTTSGKLSLAAEVNAVSPTLSWALMSALRSSSRSTHPTLLFSEARIRGVSPSSRVREFMLAPPLRRMLKRSM
mmetsp:Transcript_10103/g.24871  ORF Transcript_10103/g.24871 Transcript_10103/m.24871 type:complete len:236 (+) Transcript_10103:277-984(+)